MKAGASYAFAFIYYNHMGYYEKLSSAIYNDIMSGLRGYSSTPTMSLEQLEDDCVDERLQIIKEYFIKGRMSSGYAVLMDIEENKVDFSQMPKGWKTPKLAKCKRISARKSQMIFRKCL